MSQDQIFARMMTTTASHEISFKGIVQRILRGVNAKLKLSMLVNWRPARYSFWILKGHHHKRGIKPCISVRWLTGISSFPEYGNPQSPFPHKMAYSTMLRKLTFQNWQTTESQCKCHSEYTRLLKKLCSVTLTRQSQSSLLKPQKKVLCYYCDGVPIKCKKKNGRASSLPAKVPWA